MLHHTFEYIVSVGYSFGMSVGSKIGCLPIIVHYILLFFLKKSPFCVIKIGQNWVLGFCFCAFVGFCFVWVFWGGGEVLNFEFEQNDN